MWPSRAPHARGAVVVVPLLLLLAFSALCAGTPGQQRPLATVSDVRAVSSAPFTVDVTATLHGGEALVAAFRDAAQRDFTPLDVDALACAPPPPPPSDGSGGGARRCSFMLAGLLPDRRYQFRLAPAPTPAPGASFGATDGQLLEAAESAWVTVQGAAAPSAARVQLSALVARHVSDSSVCVTAQLSGLPASSRADAQRALQGLELVAEVMRAAGGAAGGVEPAKDPTTTTTSTTTTWERASVAAPAAVQLVLPPDDGATTSDTTATLAHVQLNVTGLPPGTPLWLRLSARELTATTAAAAVAAGLQPAAAHPPSPSSSLPLSSSAATSSFYAATVFSHALAVTTEPAPPPPPRLVTLTRRAVGVHDVLVHVRHGSWDAEESEAGVAAGGHGSVATSVHSPPQPPLPRTHALLGFAVQLLALPPPPTAAEGEALRGPPPAPPDSSTAAPGGGPVAWHTLTGGASRASLLASLASPANVSNALRIRCAANRTAVPPSAHAFEVVGRFDETRDGGLYAELSLAAQSPHPSRDACGGYEYALRVTGLAPSTLYTLRVRTYAQRHAGGAATSSGAADVDMRDVVVGPWSPPSPRFRTRAPLRGTEGAPMPPADRAGALLPPAAGAADSSGDAPLVTPPRLVAANSVSARLSWPAVLWPPPLEAPDSWPSGEVASELRDPHGGGGAVGAPAAAYSLELAAGPGDDAFEEAWRGVSLSAQLAGLQPATPYRVRVVAIRDDGTHSPPSAPISFETLAPVHNTWQQLRVRARAGGGPAPGVERLVPPPLAGASLTRVGRAAYLHGGLSAGYSCALGALSAACRAATGLRAETWRLDLDSQVWAPLEGEAGAAAGGGQQQWQQPPPRSHHVAAALGGDVYVWSGFADAAAVSAAGWDGASVLAAGASNTTAAAPAPALLLHSDMWRLDVGASPRDTRITAHAGSVAATPRAEQLPEEQSIWLPLDVAVDAAPPLLATLASAVAPGSCVSAIEATVVLSARTHLASLSVSLEGPAISGSPPPVSAGRGGWRQEVPLQPARVPPRTGWLYDYDSSGSGSGTVVAVPAPSSSFASSMMAAAANVSLVFRSPVGLTVLASCDAVGGVIDTWRGCSRRSGAGDGGAATTAPALDAFIGAPAAGQWRLRVTDTRARDNATVAALSWGLRLLSEPCVPRATWTVVRTSGVALVAASGGAQSTQTSSTTAALPPPRAAAASVTIGPDALFISSGVGQRWPSGAAAEGAPVNSTSPLAALSATAGAHDLWRFDAATSTWTQLLAPAYAAVDTAPVLTDAPSTTGALGASLAVAVGPPLHTVLSFGVGAPPLTGDDAPGDLLSSPAVADGCNRYYSTTSRVGGASRGVGAAAGGGVPAYQVRADESYACEDASTHTRFWDAAFGGRWRRLHPSLDPTAGCLHAPWCRVPHARQHAALAVVPPRAVAPAGAGGSAAAGADASDAVQSGSPPVARVLLYGGRSVASPGASAGDVDGGGGVVLGDLWALPLTEATATGDGAGGGLLLPTLDQLADGDVAPSGRAEAVAARCSGGWWSWAVQPCLTANATDAWRARRACSWELLLEAAGLADAC